MNRVQVSGVSSSAAASRVVYNTRYDYARTIKARPRYFALRFVLIILAGFIVRIWNVGRASLWTDEALTALRAQTSFQTSLNSIFSAGNQSPVYYMVLRLFPNSTDLQIRLPSVFFGCAGIALLMLVILWLYQNYDLALWGGALLAVNPFHVWMSRTARAYAMIFVLSLIVSYCFLRLMRHRQSRMLWGLFITSSMLAYLTHYSTLALAAAQFVVLIVLQRDNQRLMKKWIYAQAVSVIPVLVWLWLLSRHTIAVGPEWVPVPDWQDIPLTFWNLMLGYNGVFEWYMVPSLMIVTLGIVYGMFYAVRERRMEKENVYWFSLISLSIFTVFSISTLFVSFYVDRYFMMFLPGLLILFLQGWTPFPRRVWQSAALVLIVTSAITLVVTYQRGDDTRADFRGAADHIESHFKPGDGIVIERTNVEQAFLRYFDEENLGGTPGILLLSATPDTLPFRADGSAALGDLP
jgi:4-amino-4-deoxy-L-arabinose transferase-like glycosyltransferase